MSLVNCLKMTMMLVSYAPMLSPNRTAHASCPPKLGENCAASTAAALVSSTAEVSSVARLRNLSSAGPKPSLARVLQAPIVLSSRLVCSALMENSVSALSVMKE